MTLFLNHLSFLEYNIHNDQNKNIEKTILLDAKYNFLVKNSMPMINLDNRYVKPISPFDEIYAIHFTGVDMKLTYEFNKLDDKKIYKKFIVN